MSQPKWHPWLSIACHPWSTRCKGRRRLGLRRNCRQTSHRWDLANQRFSANELGFPRREMITYRSLNQFIILGCIKVRGAYGRELLGCREVLGCVCKHQSDESTVEAVMSIFAVMITFTSVRCSVRNGRGLSVWRGLRLTSP